MREEAQQNDRTSLEPIEGANRPLRQRLELRHEFALALLPTAVSLGVLGLVEVLSQQRLLFASLASSAFLIYLDPQHGTNTVRTLIVAQMLAACAGLLADLLFEQPYAAGGTAMVATIALMILLDAMHPPAVATALSFAFRSGEVSNLLLFALAVGITVLLVGLQRLAVWQLARYSQH